MQPLDKAFMEPLQTLYCQEIEKHLGSNPGRVATVLRAATGEIGTIGFRATGFLPCDKNMFRPHDFPPASEATCCSCKPPCFGEDQRSAIIQSLIKLFRVHFC
jgi:hypothetical protein